MRHGLTQCAVTLFNVSSTLFGECFDARIHLFQCKDSGRSRTAHTLYYVTSIHCANA